MSDESIPRYTIPNLGNIDARKLYGGSRGGKKEPEFIENTGRDSMGHVFFTTGVCWLGGFLGGGAYGSIEGYRASPGTSSRIVFNSLMNGMSKRGSKIGNTLGSIAFLHSSFYWIAQTAEVDRYIEHPSVLPAVAGFTTGALFKSTRGIRAAALAGTIGTGLSLTYSYLGPYVYTVVLGKGGRY